MINLIQNSRD